MRVHFDTMVASDGESDDEQTVGAGDSPKLSTCRTFAGRRDRAVRAHPRH